MRDTETLLEEYYFYRDADLAAGSSAAVSGWLKGLTGEERELVRDYTLREVALAVQKYGESVAPVLGQAWQGIQDALASFGEQIVHAFSQGLAPATDRYRHLLAVIEFVYGFHLRAYANHLNHHRPRGRKLSWRRLSRAQRDEAYDWWERQKEIGNAVWPGW